MASQERADTISPSRLAQGSNLQQADRAELLHPTILGMSIRERGEFLLELCLPLGLPFVGGVEHRLGQAHGQQLAHRRVLGVRPGQRPQLVQQRIAPPQVASSTIPVIGFAIWPASLIILATALATAGSRLPLCCSQTILACCR